MNSTSKRNGWRKKISLEDVVGAEKSRSFEFELCRLVDGYFDSNIFGTEGQHQRSKESTKAWVLTVSTKNTAAAIGYMIDLPSTQVHHRVRRFRDLNEYHKPTRESNLKCMEHIMMNGHPYPFEVFQKEFEPKSDPFEKFLKTIDFKNLRDQKDYLMKLDQKEEIDGVVNLIDTLQDLAHFRYKMQVYTFGANM